MTSNEARKAFEELDITERNAAQLFGVSRGKLRKGLEAEITPGWLRYSLIGIKADIASGEVELEAFEEFKNNMIGDKWTQITARQAVPILIEYAKKGETLTYGKLDELLAKKHPERPASGTLTKYSFPLGSISFTCENYRRNTMLNDDVSDHKFMPPITTIVVRKDTAKPGEGLPVLVESYLKDIKEGQDRNIDWQVDFTIKKIFAYDGWDMLLKLTEEAAEASGD